MPDTSTSHRISDNKQSDDPAGAQEQISSPCPSHASGYRQPSLFISHGSPDIMLTQTPASQFIRSLGQKLTSPDALIVISAHWETPAPVVAISASPEPRTIHDFYGFPNEMYDIQYPAPGHPALASEIRQHLLNEKFDARLHESRGLDHGAWSPLSMIWPDADIPVVQLSLPRGLPPTVYWQLGIALRVFRCRNYLIMGSGSATHNLAALRSVHSRDQAPDASAQAFVHWLSHAVTHGDQQALLNYTQAPFSDEHHPTPEHFLPLLVAAGAGHGSDGQVLHDSYDYGFLSMASYIWQ